MTTQTTQDSKEVLDILPLYDLQQRSIGEQVRHVEAYRKSFSNKEIAQYWGKKEAFIYTYMKKIGVATQYKTRTSKAKSPTKPKVVSVVEEDKKPTEVALAYAYAEQAATSQSTPQEQATPEGFGFNINGTYTAEKLIKRLEKLSMILGDEESEFEIRLSIKESV